MSLESLIFDALKGVLASRVYPDVAPEGVEAPFGTYQAVGGGAVNYVEASVPDRQNARVQVTVWAATRTEASLIGKQVEDALRLALPLQTTVLTARRSVYEEDTRRRGSMQDFDFWY